MSHIASQSLQKFVNHVWREEITPALIDYIRIPNKSPSFEPD